MDEIADIAYPGQLILHEETEDQRAKCFAQLFAVAGDRAAKGPQFQCSILFYQATSYHKDA